MHVLVANVAIFLIEALLQKVESGWRGALSCGELSNESKRERAGSNVLILGISQFTENFHVHHPIPKATGWGGGGGTKRGHAFLSLHVIFEVRMREMVKQTMQLTWV